MKEDFVAPLRDGIRAVITAVQEDGTSFGRKRRRFQVNSVASDGADRWRWKLLIANLKNEI
jgi:hypothetical protein